MNIWGWFYKLSYGITFRLYGLSNKLNNWLGDKRMSAIAMEVAKKPEYRVLRNRCMCRKCGDIIESTHRHDFVRCKCGAIFTDGGTDYIRRGAEDPNNVIDMSETEII